MTAPSLHGAGDSVSGKPTVIDWWEDVLIPGVVVTSQGDRLRCVELSPQSTEVSFHGLVKSV